MLIPNGLLVKLQLIAFSDPEMLPTSVIGQMSALINPEGYSQEYSIVYNQDQANGSSGDKGTYVQTKPENMEFRFVFDRTGVMPASPPLPDGVSADIKEFKRLTYDYHGDMHRSPYLRIIWGTLMFPCVLDKMITQYKLFRSDGVPLRAEVTATFNKFVDEKLQLDIENKQSPDLTQIVEAKAGDTLPLLTHRVYGDARYYLEVARINRLVNFKKLEPGQQIVFPPIEK